MFLSPQSLKNSSMPRLKQAAIGRSPGIGHKREDLTTYPVLFFPLGAYLIIYRAVRPTVEIVAVTRGERDIPSFCNADWPIRIPNPIALNSR